MIRDCTAYKERITMKICNFCNTELKDEDSVCPSCGGREFKFKCRRCGTAFVNANFCPQCGLGVNEKSRICPNCGKEYYSRACPDCGYIKQNKDTDTAPGQKTGSYTTYNQNTVVNNYSNSETYNAADGRCDKYVSLILWFFLGIFGAHKFYERKIGIGIIYILTCGMFGIGWIFDFFALIVKPRYYIP